MFLGTETVTINGVLNTTNTNTCESFMVCDDAVAVFNPGSAVNAAGALIVGNDDVGTLDANGAGSTRATLTSFDGKIGRLANGAGTISINDAVWTNATSIAVGASGVGTLSITNGGVVSAGTDVVVGCKAGSVGQIALSGGATLSVGGDLVLGEGPAAVDGSGSASVTVGGSSAITVGTFMLINANESLTMAGGSLTMGANAMWLEIAPGGVLSGYGTVASAAQGFGDYGTITAAGGTLVLEGSAVHGTGTLAIGAASTLDIVSPLLGHVAIDFVGQSATLDLSTGVQDYATINDFAAGDSIVMAGVNQIAWNAAKDVLTLKESGHMVDTLQFVGNFSADRFTISQSGAGGVIGLAASH